MREELRSKLAAALRPRLHELGDQAPEGHDEPVALARRLVGIGEWNPVSHQLLIGALLAAGDPTGARGVQERLDDLGWDSG